MKKNIIKLATIAFAAFSMAFTSIPVMAQGGLGPYGDIYGYYTWYINGKGWTIYQQDGYEWVYNSDGSRTYLDVYGNKLEGESEAAAKTITQYHLTYDFNDGGSRVYRNPDGFLYYVDQNGHLWQYYSEEGHGGGNQEYVADYVMYYAYTDYNGYNVYIDEKGNYWWFGNGGVPNRYTSNINGYWKDGIPNYTYYYAYKDANGYYIYRDGYNNYWWFKADGTPMPYGKKVNPTPTPTPAPQPAPTPVNPKPQEVNVDYNHYNVLECDGAKTIVYVNQYWQAPTTVSWAPAGKHLIGWDWVSDSGYVRWKPGEWIKNTGSDLYLFPVYGN